MGFKRYNRRPKPMIADTPQELYCKPYVPTMEDVDAAKKALDEFLRTSSLTPGTGAAFLAGWGKCLGYRFNRFQGMHDEASMIDLLQQTLKHHSPAEILSVIKATMMQAACEAKSGGVHELALKAMKVAEVMDTAIGLLQEDDSEKVTA